MDWETFRLKGTVRQLVACIESYARETDSYFTQIRENTSDLVKIEIFQAGYRDYDQKIDPLEDDDTRPRDTIAWMVILSRPDGLSELQLCDSSDPRGEKKYFRDEWTDCTRGKQDEIQKQYPDLVIPRDGLSVPDEYRESEVYVQFRNGLLGSLRQRGADPQEGKQPAPNETTTQAAPTSTISDSTRDQEVLRKVRDVDSMKRHYPDYNPTTAEDILRGIPMAYKFFRASKKGRWGPGAIAKQTTLRSITVGRYLKAFWQGGIRRYSGAPIPHQTQQGRIKDSKKK